METKTPQIDPVKYKNTTRDQWQTAAEARFRWSPTLNQWLGQAGFINVKSVLVDSPLLMPSSKDCVQFDRESFGALHQMMSGLSDTQKQVEWTEIEQELKNFETGTGFVGPCEMVVAIGEKE